MFVSRGDVSRRLCQFGRQPYHPHLSPLPQGRGDFRARVWEFHEAPLRTVAGETPALPGWYILTRAGLRPTPVSWYGAGSTIRRP